MIAYIEGILLEIWDKTCIVKTSGGVGYEIELGPQSIQHLPEKGEQVSLYLSQIVREDAHELYGFESLEEKRIFEILITISKVGARTALAILSVFQPAELCQLAVSGDYKPLVTVPGIGQKTAQHIFLEIKYKLADMAIPAPGKVSGATPMPSVTADALAALVNLGYTGEECTPIIQQLLRDEDDLDVASAIRLALKKLAKGRA